MSRSSAAELVRRVPWQVWAIAAAGLTAAYLARRAAQAGESVAQAVVGAARDTAVGAARVALSPVLAVADAVAPVAQAVVGTAPAAAAADAVFGVGAAVADAIQKYPGATEVLDTVFGAVDTVLGRKP